MCVCAKMIEKEYLQLNVDETKSTRYILCLCTVLSYLLIVQVIKGKWSQI